MEGGRPPRLEEIRHFADMLGLALKWNTQEKISESAEQLFWLSGMKASEHIVRKALAFADSKKKKLLFLVSYRGSDVTNACRHQERLDQPFIDFLDAEAIRYIDSLQKHVDDFRKFNLSPDRYVKRYYNGHYAPAGNHFFAYAIKDDLVNWLSPTPFTYQGGAPSLAQISEILAE
jgi:hypothetical protein